MFEEDTGFEVDTSSLLTVMCVSRSDVVFLATD